jgi:glutathione S-transferase
MKFVRRLITFRISHYCERVRWALDRISFPYVEECHLPPLHRLKTTPLGGSRSLEYGIGAGETALSTLI